MRQLKIHEFIAAICIIIAVLLTIAVTCHAVEVGSATANPGVSENYDFHSQAVGYRVHVPDIGSDDDSVRLVGISLQCRVNAASKSHTKCIYGAAYIRSGSNMTKVSDATSDNPVNNCFTSAEGGPVSYFTFVLDDTVTFIEDSYFWVVYWGTDTTSSGPESYYLRSKCGVSSGDSVMAVSLAAPSGGFPSAFIAPTVHADSAYNFRLFYQYDSTAAEPNGTRRRIVVTGSTGGF